MSECRKETSEMTDKIEKLKNLADECLGEYIKCKLKYAEIKERLIPV